MTSLDLVEGEYIPDVWDTAAWITQRAQLLPEDALCLTRREVEVLARQVAYKLHKHDVKAEVEYSARNRAYMAYCTKWCRRPDGREQEIGHIVNLPVRLLERILISDPVWDDLASECGAMIRRKMEQDNLVPYTE